MCVLGRKAYGIGRCQPEAVVAPARLTPGLLAVHESSGNCGAAPLEKLLDKILANLDLQVEPFAVCDVRRGWRLSLRPPVAVVLHFVVSGRGSFHARGTGTSPLTTDELIVVPPGIEHWIDCEGDGAHVVRADPRAIPPGSAVQRIQAGEGDPGVLIDCGRVVVTYGGVTGLFDHLHAPLFQDFSDEPTVRIVFATLLEEQTKSMPGEASMTAALMRQCFVLLLRRLCGESDCPLPWLAALGDERLGRALDAILDRPDRPHSVESLADLAGMSRTTFNERFSKAFGRTAMDFVKEARLRQGARLLRSTDLPIKAVASKVGFTSRSHFSQAFTTHFGENPVRYRAAGL